MTHQAAAPELPKDYVLVAPEELSGEALDGLVSAYVTREGTDYGERELSFATKAAELRQRLHTGEVLIVYHIPSETVDLFRREDLARVLQQGPPTA